jgi:aminoglycoside 6'-N-acetyltransferase
MTVTFSALTASHFPLLLQWLEAPHVKPWWHPDIRWTPERIKEKYDSYVQGYKFKQGIKKPIQAYIVYAEENPRVYVQVYNAHDSPREDSWDDFPISLASLDIFIGEEAFLGQGLGALILKQFLSEYVDPHYDACFLDPDTANIKAIRAYEKAGFKRIRTLKEGSITWMLREK